MAEPQRQAREKLEIVLAFRARSRDHVTMLRLASAERKSLGTWIRERLVEDLARYPGLNPGSGKNPLASQPRPSA